MKKSKKKITREKTGHITKKVLLLLGGGLALSLTRRPDMYFRILKGMRKEWKEIDKKRLHETIKKLYRSKLIDYKENKDGTITLILSEEGTKRVLRFDLEKMKIKKSARWDGLWRIVIFDVPERFKNGRDALSARLKKLGFYPIQKSVFVYPYECRDEVDFIVEIFNLKPHVRLIIAKKTDIDLDLKNHFNIW